MHIELFSFFAGVVLTLASVIVLEHLLGRLFGGKKLRNLEVEIRRQKKMLQKKDELIRKSLQSMQKEAKSDNERN